MEDTQHEDRPAHETPGEPTGEPATTAQAAAERVVRLLANPRRTRRA
ncbi:hypothetical protein [Geodermatophilus nigrescens]|uniref:Uncharacterized protein n=1 Tax=Geodermatophilus nigrescens TaxID=1070870 RepID=A0A1M5LYE7_9ACTN|nr:hypothetical protein [Geodermatophilus nigrescens]SHG70087.1 hypothetical protein SAMN05444351_2973 [Geodermatophilus nigrescens]